jgi:hypothetical protein
LAEPARTVARVPATTPVDPADRRARVAVTVMFVVNGSLFGTWAARIPSIAAQLQARPGELGLALLALAVGTIVTLPIVGRQAAHHGSRPGIVVGVMAMSAALPLAALAPNAVLLGLVLLVLGATSGILDMSMNAHGVAVEGRYGRPILSSFHAAWSLGGLGSGALGALFAAADVPPIVHFLLVSTVAGAAGLFASRWLLPREADRADKPPGLRLPPRPIALLGLLAFCGLFGEGAATDWGALYVAGPLGAGPAVGALAFATFSLTMAAGRVAGDRVVARFGPVRVTRVGAVLGASGLAVALLIGHPAAAILGLACLGAGLASVVPIVFRAGGSNPVVPTGVGIAGVASIGYAGMIAGPPTIGFAAELVGLPAALGIVVVLVSVLAVFARHVATPGELGLASGAAAAVTTADLRAAR